MLFGFIPFKFICINNLYDSWRKLTNIWKQDMRQMWTWFQYMDSMQVPVQFHRSVCWARPTGAKFDTQEGGNRDSHTQTIMIGVVTSVVPGWWICLREFHRKSSKCMWKSMVSGFVIKVHGWFEKLIPFHTLIGSFLICFPPHWMTLAFSLRWMKRMRAPATGWMPPSTVMRWRLLGFKGQLILEIFMGLNHLRNYIKFI